MKDFKLIYDSKLYYLSSYFGYIWLQSFMFDSLAFDVILNGKITFGLETFIRKDLCYEVEASTYGGLASSLVDIKRSFNSCWEIYVYV